MIWCSEGSAFIDKAIQLIPGGSSSYFLRHLYSSYGWSSYSTVSLAGVCKRSLLAGQKHLSWQSAMLPIQCHKRSTFQKREELEEMYIFKKRKWKEHNLLCEVWQSKKTCQEKDLSTVLPVFKGFNFWLIVKLLWEPKHVWLVVNALRFGLHEQPQVESWNWFVLFL